MLFVSGLLLLLLLLSMAGIVWVEEFKEESYLSKKRKRTVGKRKLEFVGWGSRPLIEFLEAIGKDATKKHSQNEVAALVMKYVTDNSLSSPNNKRRVKCDERLYAIFGKNSVPRTKVYDLLEEHLAENHDSDEESGYSSDEANTRGKKKDAVGQMKKAPDTKKSCFAAVIPDNIKLIYLKKSLVLELLAKPESFEYKVIGSFVRMRSDPHDIYQKNRFQLQLVTGVERASEIDGGGSEVRFRVANYFKDVSMKMLSDDNFTEEEIKDVQDRIKAGLLKRLTVLELELKAQMLHVDITKHSIAKELSLLRHRIDHANEKGWRKELYEYLDRRKLLQTPSEVEKMLRTMPVVIAEELEPEPKPEGVVAMTSEKAEGSADSPKSILRGTSDVSSTDASGCGDLAMPIELVTNDSHIVKGCNEFLDSEVSIVFNPIEHDNANETSKQAEEIEILPADIVQQETLISNAIGNGSYESITDSREKTPQEKPAQEKPEPPIATTTQVIELSDDESENEESKPDEPIIKNWVTGERPDDVIWNYLDPQGKTRGPFSLYALKRWSNANYFESGFTVWKSGESSDKAIPLADILGHIFPT